MTGPARQAVSHMNAPIVTTERIVLKNSVEAISCSAVWYWTARITQIDAVGIAMVSTTSRVVSCAKPRTTRRANRAPGTTMLRVKTEMHVGREIATWREYRTIPEANRATPPVALPSRSRDSWIGPTGFTPTSTRTRASSGAQTTARAAHERYG